jgi:S-adenosylmethionine/arginine decarboxylase-like enzyme
VNIGQGPSFEELDGAVLDHCNFSAVSLDAAGSPQEEQESAGHHLLVDIKNVNVEFLNSKEQLTKAMVEVVTEAKLTLLSYHNYSLEPAGVSCVGLLLESHISSHTCFKEGGITLDLFTCGPNNLMLGCCPRLYSCLGFHGRIPLSLLGLCGLMSSEDSDLMKQERNTV